MKMSKDQIVWSLVLMPVVAGIFLIARQGVVKINFEDSKLEASETIAAAETPEIVQAVYLTSISAGSAKKIDWLIELSKKSGLNSVVIDVKDFSGYVSYDSSIPEVDGYKTERLDIKDIDSLLKKLHDNQIYTIARISVFQDPALVRARPDWAVQNKYTKRPWADRNGLNWIDPACRECWNYFSSIAKEALAKGFDEINLDYIRFPSDGDMSALLYPYWDSNKMSRPQVLNEFFRHMRTELGDAKISADLFGFVTTRPADFGVGQVLEDAFEHFDYIAPMVYPSHYPAGFLKLTNPAAHPYEVVHFAMKEGQKRLDDYKNKTGNLRPNLRPWLQDFNLGADYTSAMVQAQIKATQDALGDNYNGFMLWNARNVYHDSIF